MECGFLEPLYSYVAFLFPPTNRQMAARFMPSTPAAVLALAQGCSFPVTRQYTRTLVADTHSAINVAAPTMVAPATMSCCVILRDPTHGPQT